MEEEYVEQAQGFEMFHFPYCNPFLGLRTKKEKIQKNNIYLKEIKNDSSEKRMSKCSENSQKLVKEIQKYKV